MHRNDVVRRLLSAALSAALVLSPSGGGWAQLRSSPVPLPGPSLPVLSLPSPGPASAAPLSLAPGALRPLPDAPRPAPALGTSPAPGLRLPADRPPAALPAAAARLRRSGSQVRRAAVQARMAAARPGAAPETAWASAARLFSGEAPRAPLTALPSAPSLTPALGPARVESRVFVPGRRPGTVEAPEARSVPGRRPGTVEAPEARSALWSAGTAAAAGALWLAFRAVVAVFDPGYAALSAGGSALSVLDTALLAGVGATAALTALDLGMFGWVKWKGRKVTDEQFWRFIEREVQEGRLDPNLVGPVRGRGVLRPYAPSQPGLAFTFGFTTGQAIYLRRELAATPWVFRLILSHELSHLRSGAGLAPPVSRSFTRRYLQRFGRELRSRAQEWFGLGRVAHAGLPVLWRVLSASQVSLRLPQSFEVLGVDPERGEAGLEQTFRLLSRGRARLGSLTLADSLEPLARLASDGANRSRYKAVVLYGAARWLPEGGTLDAQRLDLSFRQLHRGLEEAEAERAVRPRRSLEPALQKAWLGASGRLKGLGPVRALDAAYELLDDKGVLVLPFGPEERGFDVYERLLRFYVGRDSGRFGVTRVDLVEGGHVLVLRKLEPRVHLWLVPVGGRRIERSLTNADADPERRARALEAVEQAGFGAHRALFADPRVRVRHVFGRDVGENRIYVSVPRELAEQFKHLARSLKDMKVEPSESSFQPLLIQSGPLANAPPVWKDGYRGEGIKLAWVDTGLDAFHPDFQDRMEVADLVGEGPEDWIGHGTHVAGISAADGWEYRGMAPKAVGRMGKVFSQGGFGASDGDIMAAVTDALQWGADVINISLGSRGAPNDVLARFVSNVVQQRNADGRTPVVFGSAGNSGPFHRTLSQPAVGPNVIAVSAFTKGEKDGVVDPVHFSATGFSWDPERRKWAFKPEGGLIGGNVTDESEDVYQHGIESTKSQHMPRSPSDTPDAKHTRMSGTSMSSPMAAGVGALILQAGRTAEKRGLPHAALLRDRAAEAVKAVLMRSARNTDLPVPMVGAGLFDAKAAVELAERSLGLLEPAGPLSRLWARLFGPRAPPEEPAGWGWLERLAAVRAAEEAPFREADQAKQAAFEEAGAPKEGLQPETDAPSAGAAPAGPEAPKDEDEKAARKRLFKLAERRSQSAFAFAKRDQLPTLLAGLRDPVWLVRASAAFALMNFREDGAADALLEAGLGDADPRVRQLALRALGALPTRKADGLLRSALSDERWDVRLYAALALARHGDGSGLARVVQLLDEGTDKRRRLSAAYVAGEAAEAAGPELAEALSRRAADPGEVDAVRHHAAAALSELMRSRPEALSDAALAGLVGAARSRELVLMRTLHRVLSAAAVKPALAARFREGETRERAVAFVAAHRDAVREGGPLGEYVELLARLAGVRLDIPNPPMDPAGKGIPGVDGRLGPVQLLVQVPPERARIERFAFHRDGDPAALGVQSAAAGLDAELLERHEARLRAALPLYNSLTLEVEESRKLELLRALRARGLRVAEARPVFRSLKDTGPLSRMPEVWDREAGEGVTIAVVDEGGDPSHPAFAGRVRAVKNFTEEGGPEDVSDESVGHGTHVGGIAAGEAVEGSPYRGMAPKARLVFAKVLGTNGGTDVQVMEGQAWAASLSEDPLKDPIVVNESLGGPGTPDDPLSRSANAMVLRDFPFVAAAGNSGPRPGTVGSPANAALAVAVGSVDKGRKLAFYSSREREGAELGGWLDFGGGAWFDRENPYEIVAPLSTRLKWGDRATTVWWPGREGGRPLYQHMSGTSMASPHTAGKLAVLVGRLLRGLGTLPAGYALWLRRLVEGALSPAPYAPNEAGKGLFDDLPRALAALEERLKDPDAVRAEAAALLEEARRRHGAEPLPGTGIAVDPFGGVVEIRPRDGRGRNIPLVDGGYRPGPRPAAAARPGGRSVRDAQRSALRRELKLLLSSGGSVRPFVFRTGRGEFQARSSGLEGFLYSLRELKADQGAAALRHHWADYRSYLEALASQAAWAPAAVAGPLRIARGPPGAESERAFEEALAAAVAELQAQLAELDEAGWARRARIYELFPRAYDLEGRRRAEGHEPGEAKPFLAAFGEDDLDDILRQSPGTDVLWLMGVFEPGERVKLGHKGSPYSIRDPLRVDPELGTVEDLKRVIALAQARGVRVLLDLVPNHLSMDARLLDAHPDYFVHRPAESEGEPPEGYFLHQARDGRRLWVRHGGYTRDGKRDYWVDTAQLDYSNPRARRAMAELGAALVAELGADGLRVDMAYQLLNARFKALWGDEVGAMPEREFLEELAEAVKAAKPSAALVAENYGALEAVSDAGFDAVYNKWEQAGGAQRGWYDALRSRDPRQLAEAVRKAAFHHAARGGAASLQFTGNHDEVSPPKAFGAFWRGALALTAFLPSAQLWYAGNELHADLSDAASIAREGPKAVPFSRPVKLPWEANPELRAEHRAVFERSRAFYDGAGEASMEPLAGEGWAGYRVRTPQGELVVAANPGETPVKVRAELAGVPFEAELAPGEALVRGRRDAPPAGEGRAEPPSGLPLSLAAAPADPGPQPARARRPWLLPLLAAVPLGLLLGSRLTPFYAEAARALTGLAFMAFLPLLLPQILLNRRHWRSQRLKELEGLSPWPYLLTFAGNLLNLPELILVGNPWFLVGNIVAFASSWVILYQLQSYGRFSRGRFGAATAAGLLYLAAVLSALLL